MSHQSIKSYFNKNIHDYGRIELCGSGDGSALGYGSGDGNGGSSGMDFVVLRTINENAHGDESVKSEGFGIGDGAGLFTSDGYGSGYIAGNGSKNGSGNGGCGSDDGDDDNIWRWKKAC